MDYVDYWTRRAELPARRLLAWLELGTSKFHDWKQRYGLANEHNSQIPRDFWLEDWEKQAILDFHERYPLEGYRRLTFMMLDDDVVAVSPASVYRVLKAAMAYNDGPCVIDAEVVKEDNVFPMIPAGAALKDMLIERPKRKLEKPTGST